MDSPALRSIPVLDRQDPRLRDYVALTDVDLRREREPAEGIFIAEGEKVIKRAVAAGFAVRSFLTSPRWLAGLADVITASSAPAYAGSDELLEAITGYPVHRGALASCARRPLPTVAALLSSARHIVVLEDLVDHTNVGLIFRSAAALGMDAVVLAPRCADPLYRRAVKTSMGATLTLPYARMDEWHQGLSRVRDNGFTVIALTPDAVAEPLEDVLAQAGDRVALVLGSEGPGLSRGWLADADLAARIVQRSEVDSLNVAAAAAIACHVLAAGHEPTGQERVGQPAGAAAGQCDG